MKVKIETKYKSGYRATRRKRTLLETIHYLLIVKDYIKEFKITFEDRDA